MNPHSQTPTTPSLQVRLPARAESAELLRQRLYLWLDELGAQSDELFDVALASTEAFANAVEHPHEPTSRLIDVNGSIRGHTITITIHDYGSWRGQRQRDEGGYGFPLIRRLMGSVELHAQPDGTTITMQRQLACPPHEATVAR